MCLDLIKCFNNIRHSFGYQLLMFMGIPLATLKQWILSLMRLSRVWTVDSMIFHAGNASTGFPEGDHWSVLVMVGLATLWVTNIMKCTAPYAQLAISAYADNWAWSVVDVRAHEPILDHTLFICNEAGVSIDFLKTWYWAQNNREARIIADMLCPICGQHKPQRRDSAADLGYHLQYTGRVRMGIMETRIQEGMGRLHRLQHLPLDLRTKEHLVRSSVYPSMFHGREIRPPSDATFSKIRSKVADSLVGYCHAASPAIILLLTTGVILDPEFWLIMQVVITIRRFLSRLSASRLHKFLEIACKFHGTIATVVGPATTFSYMLSILGWQVTLEGILHVTAFESFHILKVSQQRLKRFMMLAWQEGLFKRLTERFSSFAFPDISRHDTIGVLAKFKAQERTSLLRHMAGGFQLQHHKHKWMEDATETCPFCQLPDTRAHRLYQCPVGECARLPYLDLLRQMQEDESELPEHPFVTVHPMTAFCRSTCFAHEWTKPALGLINMVSNLQAQGHMLHWCADGSCAFPHLASARFSAYAILVDTCRDDCEREQHVASFGGMKHGEGWQLVSADRTSGEQDILRAELQAICFIFLHFNWGTIHTDSQAAIDLINKAITADHWQQIIHLEHFDLLLLLWEGRQRWQCTLSKIQAHTDPLQEHNLLARYWKIGNLLADEAAKKTCFSLSQDFVDMQTDVANHVQQQQITLEQLLRLELVLMRARSTALSALQNQPVARDNRDVVCDAFANWSLERFQTFTDAADTRFLGDCAYGGLTAERTLTWLAQLRWPMDEQGPQGQVTGTAWIELAMSWMFFNRAFLPVLRAADSGGKRVIIPGSVQGAKDLQVTIAELGTNLSSVLDNVAALVPGKIVPSLHRRKCKALYMQGCLRHKQGIVGRLTFPCQREVAESLKAVFAANSNGHLSLTPDIPVDRTEDTILVASFAHRTAIAKKRMFAVRRLRRM